jgi:hypothetical protein
LVAANKLLVAGNKLLVAGNKLLIAGNKLLIAGNKLLVAGNKLLVAGNKLLVAGNKLLVAGDKLLVAGDKLLVAGDTLLIGGGKLLVAWGELTEGTVEEPKEKKGGPWRVPPRRSHFSGYCLADAGICSVSRRRTGSIRSTRKKAELFPVRFKSGDHACSCCSPVDTSEAVTAALPLELLLRSLARSNPEVRRISGV